MQKLVGKIDKESLQNKINKLEFLGYRIIPLNSNLFLVEKSGTYEDSLLSKTTGKLYVGITAIYDAYSNFTRVNSINENGVEETNIFCCSNTGEVVYKTSLNNENIFVPEGKTYVTNVIVVREDNGSHYVLNKDGKVRSLSSYGIDERSDKTVIMAVEFNRDMLGNEIYTIKTIDKILALDIDLNCIYIKRSTY